MQRDPKDKMKMIEATKDSKDAHWQYIEMEPIAWSMIIRQF